MQESDIPYPQLKSWMHTRIVVPPIKTNDLFERYAKQHQSTRFEDALLSRVFKLMRVGNPHFLWGLYPVIMGVVRGFFRFTYRLTVRGQENIPAGGCIFYSNHRGGKDVLIFLAAVRRPVAAFTDINDGWIADAFERFLSFVPRRGFAPEMVEKMIRSLVLKNRYFVMWPEGTPTRNGKIMQGFSSIVKVYAVVNAKRDVIPFVPVLTRGTEEFRKYRTKRVSQNKRFRKVLVEILKPIFIPRAWLCPPQEGGKVPREIIDTLMLVLARKLGQDRLEKNPRLEDRRNSPGAPWH
jgi:1-acyl-sn-glycerol-3-phosphate acyltransferase